MTDINTVLAELKRGTDEILSEADLIEKLKETKKCAFSVPLLKAPINLCFSCYSPKSDKKILPAYFWSKVQ